jgi:hypothetical protein
MTISSEKSHRAGYESARLSRLERALAENPEDRKLRLQVSAAKRRSDYARNLFVESISRDFDVINYRIVHVTDQYSIEGVAESLISFQGAITAVYDALKNGPKERANYNAEVRNTTRLDFGYSYPGSVGFVLTVKSEQDLLGGALDSTSEAIGQFFDIENMNQAIDSSRALGLGAVSALYKWLRSNARNGNSVDLNWRHSVRGYTGRFIDLSRFEFLERMFASVEEHERSPLNVEGFLVGLDVETRRFHFVEPNGASYKGRLSSEFGGEPREVPNRYKATLIKVETRVPATGKFATDFELASLTSN